MSETVNIKVVLKEAPEDLNNFVEPQDWDWKDFMLDEYGPWVKVDEYHIIPTKEGVIVQIKSNAEKEWFEYLNSKVLRLDGKYDFQVLTAHEMVEILRQNRHEQTSRT